jgi:predicted DNA-binding transcriptional regulator AlpA
MTKEDQEKIEKIIDKHSKKFYSKLIKNQYPTPTFLKLMMFRWARSSMKSMLNEKYKDYRYYKEKGWFESDYFYSIKLSQIKKLTGKIFDKLGTKMARNN